MPTFIQFSLAISAFLIVFADGASVKNGNCGAWNFRKHFKCLFKELIFAKDLALINLNDSNGLLKLQSSCDALHTCYSTMECQNVNTIDLTNKMKAACEGLTYIAEEYSDCARKMEGVRERCKPRTTCLNLFGEKNCAVDAIIERCSLEEWIGFRNSIIKLMTVADSTCDVEQYRKLGI